MELLRRRRDFLRHRQGIGSNRVPPEVEIAGLDIPEMGAPGYPEFIESIAPEQIPASQIAEAKALLAMS